MKAETQTISKTVEHTPSRREKLAKRFLPALALGLVAGGYAANKLSDKAEYVEVASVTTELNEGETPIDAVREGLSQISYSENGEVFEPAESDIVSEGQEVSKEIKELTGEAYTQPGDDIKVSLLKNELGQIKIEADPVPKHE